jgi:hypothetical protein
MPFLELFDETLDINSTENYELSIQLSQEGIAYLILDTIRNKYIMLRSFGAEENKAFSNDELEETIKKDDFLTRRYKKVNLVLPSRKYTLVPSPLYDPGRKDEYFSFNHTDSDTSIILNNKVSEPDSFLVFSVSKPINELVKRIYPGVHPFHHLKPLLEYLSSHKKENPEQIIHLHVERDFINLVVFNHNTLTFSNSFSYRNISDILYYVLNVMKNLDIKQEETVVLSGLTERYDDLFSNLSLYIRNVKFAELSGKFTFSYVFNDIGLHRYINLIGVANCVL